MGRAVLTFLRLCVIGEFLRWRDEVAGGEAMLFPNEGRGWKSALRPTVLHAAQHRQAPLEVEGRAPVPPAQ